MTINERRDKFMCTILSLSDRVSRNDTHDDDIFISVFIRRNSQASSRGNSSRISNDGVGIWLQHISE